MLSTLARWWKRWRAKEHEYEVERALYKMEGGAPPPSTGGMTTWTPPTVSHGPDPSQLSEDAE